MMINVSSEVDFNNDKGVLVLAHVISHDNTELLNTYAFKSEDIIKQVYIENEVLHVQNDTYQDVDFHVVTSLGANDPTLDEMLQGNMFLLHDLARRIREQIKLRKCLA